MEGNLTIREWRRFGLNGPVSDLPEDDLKTVLLTVEEIRELREQREDMALFLALVRAEGYDAYAELCDYLSGLKTEELERGAQELTARAALLKAAA